MTFVSYRGVAQLVAHTSGGRDAAGSSPVTPTKKSPAICRAFILSTEKRLIKMAETFFATLSPMLVMFMCMLVGFILKKKNLVPDDSDKVISKLENYICVPALVISTFMNYCTVASLKQYYNLILYALIALAAALVISLPLSKVFAGKDKYKRSIYKYALTFGNFGFMGNAIVPAILGAADNEILYKYLLFTLPLNVLVYTWGIMILIPEGETKQNPIKSLINPIFISIILGAAIGLTGATSYIPSFIVQTIDYLKACMAPLAMILTGFVIGQYSFKSLLTNKRVYIATALRLFIIPAVLISVLMLTGASELVITLAFFAFATPLGLNTVVFPAAYGGETQTGAAMAMISHTLCVITIPIMFMLLNTVI